MHVRSRATTAASMVAVLPRGIGDGQFVRAYVALGSPCVSIFIPAFPSTAGGPPPFIPFELSNYHLWLAADALRQQVEEDPTALADIRRQLSPVESDLWAEADDVADRPELWPVVGESWGRRVFDAIVGCQG
jgi:hypothetical protein